jgi:hypothetical protein
VGVAAVNHRAAQLEARAANINMRHTPPHMAQLFIDSDVYLLCMEVTLFCSVSMLNKGANHWSHTWSLSA